MEEVVELMLGWQNPLPAVTIGFWFMPDAPKAGGLVGCGLASPPHTLVVLTHQKLKKIPGAEERILKQLVQKASEAPQWNVIIQADYSLPVNQYPLNASIKQHKSLPGNISFGPAENLPVSLGRCSACLTMSSPWILTAMAWGRPSLVMSDYGISIDQGTVQFFGSGAMHRLSELPNLDAMLDTPSCNKDWLHQMGWGIHNGAERLVQALRGFAQDQ
jgi:hypothetical protein